jgi:hypothetical protein
MDHECSVCYQKVSQHDETCWANGVEHRHWPALCCPGCVCQSFEAAHSELHEPFKDPEPSNASEEYAMVKERHRIYCDIEEGPDVGAL